MRCVSEPLLECVPNVSTSRDRAAVAACAAALSSGRAWLLDVHADDDHDRSVFTCVGSATDLAHALGQLAAVVADHVDLRDCGGVHPRVGALDVVPVVPLEGLVVGGGSIDDALGAVPVIAESIASASGIPVVRYGIGGPATTGSTGLVRSGGAAELAARVEAGEVQLAAGSASAVNERHGWTMCGARPLLVACNAVLTRDADRERAMDTASVLARAIRERSGGLAGVRALPFWLARRGRAQVSMNVERPNDVSPAEVVRQLRQLAHSADTGIAEFEIVGLAPSVMIDELGVECGKQPHGAREIALATCDEPRLEVAIDAALAGR